MKRKTIIMAKVLLAGIGETLGRNDLVNEVEIQELKVFLAVIKIK